MHQKQEALACAELAMEQIAAADVSYELVMVHEVMPKIFNILASMGQYDQMKQALRLLAPLRRYFVWSHILERFESVVSQKEQLRLHWTQADEESADEPRSASSSPPLWAHGQEA